MKTLVLTFDRLPVSFLGCYGRSNAATPNFDRLAASSVVFDQHYAEQVDSVDTARAWQTGRHHFPRAARDDRELADVGKLLSGRGVETALIRERIAETPLPEFQQTIEVAGREGSETTAEETPFFQLVARAESLLAEGFLAGEARRLLWLHSHGPSSDWRPPREFARRSLRRRFASVDDSETDGDPADGAPIDEWPDEAFDEFSGPLLTAAAGRPGCEELTFNEWQVARAIYAGGIELIDEALGRLLDALDEREAGETPLLIVAAAAGMAVGERRMLSLPATSLPEERVHAPLLVRVPNAEPGTRRQQLVQTVDLPPTLLDWFGAPPAELEMDGFSLLPAVGNSDEDEREFICLGNAAGATAIRTPERYLVVEPADEAGLSPPPQLFVKPDDVWEVNEVAAQSPDEVETLCEMLKDATE